MADCLFCKIIEKKLPARIVYEDEGAIAFEDINPQAPTHVLIVPRKHVSTLNDLGAEDDETTGRLFRIASQIAKDRGFADRGWRAVMNCNREAGQTVFHVHMHVLGGRPMEWPPG